MERIARFNRPYPTGYPPQNPRHWTSLGKFGRGLNMIGLFLDPPMLFPSSAKIVDRGSCGAQNVLKYCKGVCVI